MGNPFDPKSENGPRCLAGFESATVDSRDIRVAARVEMGGTLFNIDLNPKPTPQKPMAETF